MRLMPDFTQSVEGLEPPTVVDHVLLPVADLEVGAQRFYERFGLKGIPGGRHPGVGTANVIVPLGLQYLELIAVVDQGEAASSRLGGRVARALKEGRMFVAWALRTQDLDAVRARVQGAGSRERSRPSRAPAAASAARWRALFSPREPRWSSTRATAVSPPGWPESWAGIASGSPRMSPPRPAPPLWWKGR